MWFSIRLKGVTKSQLLEEPRPSAIRAAIAASCGAVCGKDGTAACTESHMVIACLADSRRSEAATVRGLVATESVSGQHQALQALQGALSKQDDTGLVSLLQAQCAGCFDSVLVDPVGSSTGVHPSHDGGSN